MSNKFDSAIFASDAKKAELDDFPDVGRGWGVTIDQTNRKPPMSWMNAAFNRVDKNINYLVEQGVAEWQADIDYPEHAIVKEKDVLYISIVESSINKQPSKNQNEWKLFNAEIEQSAKQYADELLSKHEKSTNHPRATLNNLGFTQLSDDLTSNSITEAATINAVTKTMNIAQSNKDILDTRVPLYEEDITNTDINLNDLKIPLSGNQVGYNRIYSNQHSASCTADKNYPVKIAGLLTVSSVGPYATNNYNITRQIYRPYNNMDIYERIYTHTESIECIWSDWVKVQGMTQNLSDHGWCKLPNGLIIQWGLSNTSSVGNEAKVVPFSISFPTACLLVHVQHKGTVTTGSIPERTTTQAASTYTKANFQLFSSYSGAPITSAWFAIGH